MEIFTGDETGLLKQIAFSNAFNINSKSLPIINRFGNEQNRSNGIVSIHHQKLINNHINAKTNASNDTILHIIRKNHLELWKITQKEQQLSHSVVHLMHQIPVSYREKKDNKEIPVSFSTTLNTTLNTNNTLNNSIYNGFNLITYQDQLNPIITYEMNGLVYLYPILQDDEILQYDNKNKIEYDIQGPLHCGTCSKHHLLFGGYENDIQIYNIETKQLLWKAKNVSHDKLNLRIPIYNTDIQCINSFSNQYNDINSLKEESNGIQFITGTGYKYVRVYDTRTSNQPIISIKTHDEYRITCICISTNDTNRVYIGDVSGGCYLWDITKARRINSLLGAVGSIRDIQISENKKYVATVSLDRYLRIYSTKTHKLITSVYLKNKLTCCNIFSFINEQDDNEDEDVEERNEDEEDVLESIEDEESSEEEMDEQLDDKQSKRRKQYN